MTKRLNKIYRLIRNQQVVGSIPMGGFLIPQRLTLSINSLQLETGG